MSSAGPLSLPPQALALGGCPETAATLRQALQLHEYLQQLQQLQLAG